MKSLCLSLLSLTLLFLPPALAEDNEIIGSTQAFRRLMKNTLLRDYFTNLQQDLIPTRFDSKIRNFFRNDQIVSQLYQAHIDNEDKALQNFINRAQTNMMRLRKVMGSEQGRQVHRMVVQLARSLGFSTEAVENIMIYVADGSKNAFTVNASKNRIIIVFQSALLESMELSEIRAIVGHELGHIVLGHTNMSKMNMFMINLLQSVFINPTSASFSMKQQLNESFTGHTCNHGFGVLNAAPPFMKLSAADFLDIRRIEMQAYASLSAPENIRARDILLFRYLNLALEAMNEYLAPAQSIAIIKSFRDDLKAVIEDPTKHLRRSDLQDFGTAVTDLLGAFSRSQEVSSDRVSDTAIRRDYLASSFIRLLGLANFKIDDRHKLIKQMQEQGEEILNRMDRETLAEHIGSSHPSSVLRIYLITQMPSYPSNFIANPFTKLLALNQYTAMEKALARFAYNRKAESKEELQSQGYFGAHFKEVSTASEETVTSILKLLERRKINDKHPRLNNLIQYSLVQREMQLNQIKELQDQIAEKNIHPQIAEALKHRLDLILNVFFPENAEFIDQVIKSLIEQKATPNELSQSRIAALNVAARSMDLQEVQKVRLSMLQMDPNRHWMKEVLQDLKAPNFIVPRVIQQQEVPAEKVPSSLSLVRMFGCDRVLGGGG